MPLQSRLIALGATLLILATLGAWIHHKGVVSGRQSVQARFDEYRASVQAQAARQAAETKATEAATAARNEAIHHDYQAQLAALAADRDSLSRLYNNKVRACSSSMPTNTNKSGASDSSSQPTIIQTPDGLLDAYSTDCRADAIQLNSLIEQVKGQLSP